MAVPHAPSSANNLDLPVDTNLTLILSSLTAYYEKKLEWTGMDIDTETDSEEEYDQLESDSEPRPASPSPTVRRKHWRREMQLLESKLKGKADGKHFNTSGGRRGRKPIPDCVYSSSDLLSDYGQLMLVRMESCRRVQRLVAYSSRSRMKHGSFTGCKV
ncbi:hypothetical protein MIND_00746200 [Mycena indigotica]|uniref:Uncharacterized protein n=1 Tax=Mycena indigotica TaxID=2126181 RepID=A0A8H6SL82_9AGAR|nr:uncharacterized protein MIND_00746200 [Mycena indigotica]KAF7301805.1 hypothetical protein MIND_00746200 [Mycena indigotica]